MRPPERDRERDRETMPRRERRSSRTSSAAYDEYESRAPGGSPDVSHRNMSHSPSLHRDRDHRDRDRDRERDREADRDRDSNRDRERDHERYSPPQHAPAHATRSHSRSSLSSPQAHRSPYQATSAHNNGDSVPGTPRHYIGASSPPPPVPAPFASIMHAYPAPPITPAAPSGSPEGEYVYANGNGSRRNGHGSVQAYSGDR